MKKSNPLRSESISTEIRSTATPLPAADPRPAVLSFYSGLAILALTAIALVVSRSFPTWDEEWLLQVMWNFDRLGLSLEFLRTIHVAPGPMLVLLQQPFKFLTGGALPGIRWISFAFLVLLAVALCGVLRAMNHRYPKSGFQILGSPLFPLLGAIAMSDVPAAAFFYGSLWGLVAAYRRYEKEPALAFWLAVAAGLSFGTSVIGRQVFLFGLAGLPLLWLKAPASFRKILAAFAVSGAILPGILFSIWGGTLAPTYKSMLYASSSLLAPVNGWGGLAHTAIFYLIFDLTFITKQKKLTLLSMLATLVIVVTLQKLEIRDLTHFLPLGSYFARWFPSWLATTLSYGFTVASFGLAVPFLAHFYKWFRETSDPIMQFFHLGAFALAMTPMLITHNYSSRYPLVCIPMLLLLQLLQGKPDTYAKTGRLMIGGAFGVAVLFLYTSR
jgi:hypothetical protein